MSRAVLLDNDMASDVDDALCLALAFASPEIELVGLTTVGNHAGLRAQVTSRLLELAGVSDVPVFAGCRVPLLGGRGFNWFGHEGEGILEPGREPPIADEHAVNALLRITRERDDVDLVAVGPMTNLAAALTLDPDLASRVRSLTIMGGHVRRVAYGGVEFEPGIDYNLCSDPQASYVVLRSGMPTTLVTADVTLETWITRGILEAIDAAGTPFHTALADAMRIWARVWTPRWADLGCRIGADHVAFLHDPLTLAVLYDPSLCRFETLEIEPAIEPSGLFRTLERDEASDHTFPMRCAVEVDAERFRRQFSERVAGFKPA